MTTDDLTSGNKRNGGAAAVLVVSMVFAGVAFGGWAGWTKWVAARDLARARADDGTFDQERMPGGGLIELYATRNPSWLVPIEVLDLRVEHAMRQTDGKASVAP